MNCNGIAEKKKRDLIFDYLRTYKADFVFLQETHNDNESTEQLWEKECGGQCLWSRGSNRSCGAAILLKPGLDCNVTRTLRDHEGRTITATLNVDGLELNLMNIYAPNKPRERKWFFENLWQYKPGDKNLILAGDFNCLENLDLDKQGGNPLSGNLGTTELRNFTENNSLIDTWRVTHPGDRIFTWNNKDFTLRSRLDRWYITAKLHEKAASCIRTCPHSDHSVAEITIKPDNINQRGKGVWKLNYDLLKDRALQREIRAFHSF